ncbi:MAG: hypothetical protein H6750_09295 [Nitrospiraceae bacterium]|nr:hypothetical protein [Nitrospira sp.]MCB9774502.1 hypothetical protein [Nitrospiraceae bacterium]
MPTSLLPSLELPEDLRETLEQYVKELQKDWGADLESLLLYGSAARGDFIAGRSNFNFLVLVRALSVSGLQRAGQLHRKWGKHQIVAPLVMTQEELSQTRTLFPLEYFQMQEHHVRLAGKDPFGAGHIDRPQLGWQCEHELLANVFRMRQRFVEGEGRPEAIRALLMLSITSVLPCVRGILRVLGHPSKGKDVQILECLPHALQFDPTVLVEVLQMKRGLNSPGSLEWSKVYERYLQSVEGLLKQVQAVRQESGVG